MQPNGQPNYEFIMKGNQATKKGSSLPKLPRPAAIALGVVVGLFLIIVISSLLFGGKSSNAQDMINAAARATEIARVSGVAAQAAQDNPTRSLATTVQATMSSQSAQITHYLKQYKKMAVSTTALVADQNKNTDSQIQTAAQNNNLTSSYKDYLRSNLALYQTDLQTAYKSAGTNGKNLLSGEFNNVQTILNSL